ncbi:MAG: UDP-N-acetylglucosamine 1-carboxyvinyltransferase [Candidatus Gracilibacteria bacterium]|jgi:UDP-N-acetylglucosamine 1-carboxyvinyltransferase
MLKFIVHGGHTLSGSVQVGGSKNAALPILAATLLAKTPSTLTNVPDISDVHAFLKIMSGLGAICTFDHGTVTVDPKNLTPSEVDQNLVKHMRASILLLGPLLARFQVARLAYPGGCVLGKRSIGAHLAALTALGATAVESTEEIHLKSGSLHSATIDLPEASVTATENALMLAVTLAGTTEINNAAMEPHVQDLCYFLTAMGAQIEGIGTSHLTVSGPVAGTLHGTTYAVTPDYLEAGTFILAGVLTNSKITVENCKPDHLGSFLTALVLTGAEISITPRSVTTHPHGQLKNLPLLKTAVHPGFPTDLQAPFTVLLTQCAGQSTVNETLFEGRLNYLGELSRMGANAEILSPVAAQITGPTPLNGARIASCDIRAGAAMVLAALIAKGETTITDINYIDRGYEQLDSKLRSLGAKIERISE